MTDKQRYQMERWKLLIEDETRNEMKLKDWLKLRGITKDAYYYWLHKFQRENIDSALQELPAQIQQTPSFVEISKPEAAPFLTIRPFLVIRRLFQRIGQILLGDPSPIEIVRIPIGQAMA